MFSITYGPACVTCDGRRSSCDDTSGKGFGSDQTGTHPRFVDFAQKADVLVMHFTIGAGAASPLHAAPDVVGRVARDAAARHLVVSHIAQFDLDPAVAEVKKAYAGPVAVGADLLCIAPGR